MKRSPRSGKSDSGPCHIGKILGSVLASDNGCISENRAAEDKPAKPKFALERADEDRIIKLERQLEPAPTGCRMRGLHARLSGGRP